MRSIYRRIDEIVSNEDRPFQFGPVYGIINNKLMEAHQTIDMIIVTNC